MFRFQKSNILKTLSIVAALYIGHNFYVNSEQYQLDRIYGMLTDHVVAVTTEAGNSGGTGFYVVTPKGKSYILTNAHVCGVKNSENQVFISNIDSERRIPHKIIEESSFTDLCLIENSENHHGGLQLSDNWFTEDARPNLLLYILGHPKLLPQTLTKGTIIDTMKIEVMDHFGWDNCDKPKHSKKTKPGFFGEAIEVCILDLYAYSTNIVILPGNSGSPAVNTSGRLVGVAFAGDRESHWGSLITIEDIRAFLRPY